MKSICYAKYVIQRKQIYVALSVGTFDSNSYRVMFTQYLVLGLISPIYWQSGTSLIAVVFLVVKWWISITLTGPYCTGRMMANANTILCFLGEKSQHQIKQIISRSLRHAALPHTSIWGALMLVTIVLLGFYATRSSCFKAQIPW